MTLACERDGVRIFLAGADGAACALRLALSNDPNYAGPTAGPALSGARHFLHGADPTAWRTATAHAAVIYEQILPGVSLRLRESSGRVEYDVLLAPGANLESFTIHCEGANALHLKPDGALLMLTAAGPLRHTPPRTWQIAPDGTSRQLASAFVLGAPHTFGFRVKDADPALPTVVDPGLEWSTFLGGSSVDVINAVAAAAGGDWIVVGKTRSPDFPATTGSFNVSGAFDGFVTRITADGSQIVWSALLGGSGQEEFVNVAVDSTDRAVVVGYTTSADFPTTSAAWDRHFDGSPEDGIVLRMLADGSGLDWSTFLGGSVNEKLNCVVIAPGDEPVVVGETESPDYPRYGSAASAMSGPGTDATVTRISEDGARLPMSTCISGPLPGFDRGDVAHCVRLMPGGGTVVVGGDTEDDLFPTTPGSLGSAHSGLSDGFLAIVDLTTGARLTSTLVGGSDEEGVGSSSLAVDATGQIYLAVNTSSADFPMPVSGYDLLYDGRGDVAVIVLDAALSGVAVGVPLAGTFLGTPRDEEFATLALAPDGSVLVAGSTNHPGFPTTLGAWDTVHNGGTNLDDAFVVRLDPTLTTLLYSSFVGGSSADLPTQIAAAGNDAVVLACLTGSADFATRAGAADDSFNGVSDGFLLRLDLRLCPILAVQPDPLRRGQPASFRVSELTPGERAYVAYTLTGVGFGSAPPRLGGLRLDLIGAVALLGQTPPANAAGVATLALTVPPGAPLVTLWTQAAVARGPAGALSLKSSVVARTVAP
jgi:hypothetical protein